MFLLFIIPKAEEKKGLQLQQYQVCHGRRVSLKRERKMEGVYVYLWRAM